MRSFLKVALLSVFALVALSAVAYGASAPWTANPGTTYADGVVTLDNSDPDVTQFGTSYENSSLDVPVENGDVITFEYRLDSQNCGGGVPRIFIQGGAYNTWDDDPTQCADHEDLGGGWFRVTQDIEGITDGIAGHTGIVNDQTSDRGVMQVRNVVIAGVAVLPPSSKSGCKNGGWKLDGYKNQGACVSSFAKAK